MPAKMPSKTNKGNKTGLPACSAAWMPLDPHWPPARVQQAVCQARPFAIIVAVAPGATAAAAEAAGPATLLAGAAGTAAAAQPRLPQGDHAILTVQLTGGCAADCRYNFVLVFLVGVGVDITQL